MFSIEPAKHFVMVLMIGDHFRIGRPWEVSGETSKFEPYSMFGSINTTSQRFCSPIH